MTVTTISAGVSAWMSHAVTVERLTGSSSQGPVYDAPAVVSAFIDPGDSLVRSATGDAVTSTATCYMPTGTATIPVGSKVTLPLSFGGRTAVVLLSANRSSDMFTPDHVEVKLT